MEAKAEKVIELLKLVAEISKNQLGYTGLFNAAEKINEAIKGGILITGKYLYGNLLNVAQDIIKNNKNETISCREEHLNKIAKYVGYSTYFDFEKSEHKELDPQLKSCEGLWYSFVRCNSGKADILKSPVRIWEENRKMQMSLKGPSREFKGELRKNGINLFAFLETDDAKELHLVFKIGIAARPEVVQGVFSGISSAGDPISGKEVLVRIKDKVWEQLKNERISIKDAEASSEEVMRLLAKCFKDYEGNSLKVSGGSTFSLSDLE